MCLSGRPKYEDMTFGMKYKFTLFNLVNTYKIKSERNMLFSISMQTQPCFYYGTGGVYKCILALRILIILSPSLLNPCDSIPLSID